METGKFGDDEFTEEKSIKYFIKAIWNGDVYNFQLAHEDTHI